MQPPVPLSAEHREPADGPLLLNLLPWPDQPYLSSPDLQRLSSTLQVETAGLPEHLRAAGVRALAADPDSPLYQYLRARGLTFLDTGSMIFVMCGCVWEDGARVQQVATPA